MTPVLVTIPLSHFCEKARWALDRARIRFEERRHLPLFQRRDVRWAGGDHSVPALRADGVRLSDSTDILRWIDERAPEAGLYPRDPELRMEALALEDRFDVALGPATRRVAYYHLMPAKGMNRYVADGVPRHERLILPMVRPAAILLMKRKMDIRDATAAESERVVRDVFAEVGTLIEGKKYLVGDAFTVADLTFASLAAPVLLPPQYGSSFPTLPELPPRFRALVEELRATPAGAWAMRLYQTERRV